MEVHSEQGCDVISRLKAVSTKFTPSLNMIDFGLDNLPGGPLMVEGFTYIPHPFCAPASLKRRVVTISTWSMTGDNQKLYRWRCRAATYAKLADAALYAARQHRLRRAADYRQPRPVLLLYRPDDRGRCA
ncbi:Formate hydrogenlyase subunit 5 [Salmonella enterica subsp. enterica]|nr:Formate hydrogenlyase subunit 5 [Salmonella enterica subsp. enterica]